MMKKDMNNIDIRELTSMFIENIIDRLVDDIPNNKKEVDTENIEVSTINKEGDILGCVQMSPEDIQLITFASNYINEYIISKGKNMEEYRKFFKGEVLPKPTLKDVITYMK